MGSTPHTATCVDCGTVFPYRKFHADMVVCGWCHDHRRAIVAGVVWDKPLFNPATPAADDTMRLYQAACNELGYTLRSTVDPMLVAALHARWSEKLRVAAIVAGRDNDPDTGKPYQGEEWAQARELLAIAAL